MFVLAALTCAIGVIVAYVILRKTCGVVLSWICSTYSGVDVVVDVGAFGFNYLADVRIRFLEIFDVRIREIRITSRLLELPLLSADVTGVRCDLRSTRAPDSVDLTFEIELITLNGSNGFKDLEFGAVSLCLRRSTARRSDGAGDIHYWGSVLNLAAGMAKFYRNGPHKTLQIQMDECQVEWDEEVFEEIAFLVKPFLPAAKKPSHEEEPTAEETQTFVVQTCIRNLDVFLTARKSGFLLFFVDCLRMDSPSSGKLLFWAESVRLDEGIMGNSVGCTRNTEISGDFAELTSNGECARFLVRMAVSETRQELFVHVESEFKLAWSPLGHVIVYEAISSARAKFSALTKKPEESNEPTPSPLLVINIVSDFSAEVSFRLPRDHLLQFQVPSIHIQKTAADMGFSVNSPHLTILVDGESIVMAENPLIRRLQMDVAMDMNRREFKQLKLRTNKVWSWTADSIKFHFPYAFDFAAAYEEIVNSVKFVKKVHGKKRKPFTADSPLPCDLHIAFKQFTMQMDDDPFEVQLQTNYELMVDEVYECQRRRDILEKKLQDYKTQRNFYVTAAKEAELYEALMLRNAKIYVNRARQLRANRTALFVWDVKNVELRAYADTSLHGEKNVIRMIQQFNAEAPLPTPLRFSTLWARCFEMNMGESRMQFRDYPLPYTQFTDAYFWGPLVGAEHFPEGNRSMRDTYVPLPEPWGMYNLERNMCPLKFYYDIGCEMTEFNSTYGPCWEPCLTMISLCWNKVNSPSKDPSPPLPFWDKIRLLLHGRFSLMSRKFVTSMLASSDPYNSTELVEFSWENFGFDWTDGVFHMTTDVNAYIRTASKYDDSRLLHLPGFKLKIQLEWVCMSKQYDHHSVLPCAPDKLPEYSANEVHDSYRAFRSSHLNVCLTFEAKTLEEIPQILLYSNTLKWLDYLKNTLTIQNRPIRQGRLFGSRPFKKNQISRHYKHVQINVSLPKFYVSYWMSFASSHGFRVISNSMNLTSSLQLHILPPEKKSEIRRRPVTSWKVSHVSVQMENCQIHLFGDQTQPTATASDDDDSFFVGLERLSYIHESCPQRNPNLKPEDQQLSPNHHLTVHDLRASWNVQNRDTCLAIADGVQKAHVLKKILSTNALRNLNLETLLARQNRKDHDKQERNVMRNFPEVEKSPARIRAETLNSTTQSCSFDADGILAKLVDEAGTKLVAYSEETVEPSSESLHGVTLCEMKDVIAQNWQIDLLNCQAILKGCDKDGFVLLTAARASVKQRIHQPVWRHAQLLAKKSWTAALSGMQYFAPQYSINQNPPAPEQRRKVKWLDRSVIDEKPSASADDSAANDHIDVNFDSFLGLGEAVGGIISGGGPPLQRVVSRCSCQLFFCYFNDAINLDLGAPENQIHNWPPADRQKLQQRPELGNVVENVDCFTLKCWK
ncbi:hypothetical protein L596_027227 [Steinernema carpocapsae]|uniref:FMP27/BLTP2/Hobbit GFWDK motif-containing RBG unit domain-containing protein n=1 Tax=Steinernema carpocapsae TaxID=34508 RepID=A0A4U5M3R5_STECR|nr:hypothetical protein L596_027227 [Steinernema carpocapsae]